MNFISIMNFIGQNFGLRSPGTTVPTANSVANNSRTGRRLTCACKTNHLHYIWRITWVDFVRL
jgi:hypothetical protein